MAVIDWIFPRLEAKPGAWRRYWVQLVAFPPSEPSPISESALSRFCLCMGDASMKRRLLDADSRQQAKKERQALRELQRGVDVRDLPGTDFLIRMITLKFQELEQRVADGSYLQKMPLLVGRLSQCAYEYTFRPDIEARVFDRLLGAAGRKTADGIANAWLKHPTLEYLNQDFHPLAEHYRYPYFDKLTKESPSSSSSIERADGRLPRYPEAHGGTNPATFPYEVTFVGPTPYLPDPTSELDFSEAPLVQLPCTLPMFERDWPGSDSPETSRVERFESAELVPFNRAYQVNSRLAWLNLVKRYPLEMSNEQIRSEFQRLTGMQAVFLGVDWEKVREDYDVVHFAMNAVLECADVGLEVELPEFATAYPGIHFAAVMYRVVPGSTIWLNL